MKRKTGRWLIVLLANCCLQSVAFGQNITRVEYFIDSDPGFGAATVVSISPAAVINNIPVNVNIAALANGIHNIYFRSRNSNGWSQTNRWLFIKQQVNTTEINKLEYYLDNVTDPGFGNAVNVPVTPAATVSNLVFPVNVSGLTNGIHNLYIRSRDNNGNWSITNRWLFIKQPINSTQVTKLEYYLDNIPDPGFGNATPVSITPATSVNDLVIPVNISALTNGVHNVYVRSRDNNGSWSITNRWFFLKQQVNASQVTKLEYFLDNIPDPGFGKATAVSFTPSASVEDVVIPVDISALSTGIHQLYVRSYDNTGNWSITNRWLFLKTTVTGNVVKAEYFVNTDPGFGKATNIPITAGTSVNDIQFAINNAALPLGLNNLQVRSQNADGSWSLTNRWLFWNDSRSGLVDKMEYYYDTDPGFGNGIPIAMNATSIFPDYLVPVNVTGLTLGEHVIYLRSHSQRGWSITNKDTFNVTVTSPTPFINVNSVTQRINCAWNSFRISFHATGTYNAGNHFKVQLSNGNGSFASPIVIGDTATTRSSEVYCVLPVHLPEGTNYRVRVVSTNAVVTGIDGIDAMTIHDRPELGNDTSVYIVCSGETYNLVPLYSPAGFTTAGWSTPTPETAPAGNHNFIVSNVYGCKDTATAFAKQDVAIWTGAISKNWHVAGNWSNGHIPNEKTHVIIQGITTNNCEISASDGVAGSVQVKASGSISLINNRKLFVNANCNPLPSGQ